MPRLTPERTAEADAIAHFYPAVERDINRNLIMSARVLDLLDAIDERIEVERRTVATLTARAEQAEKDAALLAEVVRIAMGDAPALIQLSQSQQAAFNRALASGALQRAKGGA